ncbi:STAS domain-containing protein [Sphaerimonospora mesophila]|uniref:STAS domain-containing protein n=1 Tax=Sphaerimonospora mesophila TaxID=37483 RepID=UPI0006E422FE
MPDPHISTAKTKFAAERDGDIGVLTLEGTIDYTTHKLVAEFFDEAFAEYGPNLVVDLLDVDFLDSRATGLLIACWKRAVDEGGRLSLVALERGATRVLWIAGLTAHIPVFATMEESLAAARGTDR